MSLLQTSEVSARVIEKAKGSGLFPALNGMLGPVLLAFLQKMIPYVIQWVEEEINPPTPVPTTTTTAGTVSVSAPKAPQA